MKPARLFVAAALAALALFAPVARAAGAIGPTALKSHYTSLAPQLAHNAFGGSLVLQSEEVQRRIDGDVYAVLDHPFAQVSAALSDPGQWCDILILHLNTKYCHRSDADGVTRVLLRVGRKEPQAIDAASLLTFEWRPPQVRPDYLAALMESRDGPYDTRDYRLLAEAVPLDAGHTFLHMGYAFSYGGASHFAMHIYLSTIGRDKVGFTRVPAAGAAGARDEDFVGGMRGVAERNTMRYYLAIDAYLSSLSAPPGQQLEKRLAAWFDATEKYPRQLHEVDRDAYLRMKRNEVQRQAAVR